MVAIARHPEIGSKRFQRNFRAILSALAFGIGDTSHRTFPIRNHHRPGAIAHRPQACGRNGHSILPGGMMERGRLRVRIAREDEHRGVNQGLPA